jgi:predicted dienelactone hydrolase
MLADWPDAGRIDSGRIGLFGFSVGGYTGLVVIGGNPDSAKAILAAREPICVPCPSARSSRTASFRAKPPHMIHASRQQSSSIPGRHSCCLPIISRP